MDTEISRTLLSCRKQQLITWKSNNIRSGEYSSIYINNFYDLPGPSQLKLWTDLAAEEAKSKQQFPNAKQMRPQEGVEKEIPSPFRWAWRWGWVFRYGCGCGYGCGWGVGVVECRVFGVKSIKSKQQKQELYGAMAKSPSKAQPGNTNKMFAVRRLICLHSIADDDNVRNDRWHSGLTGRIYSFSQ